MKSPRKVKLKELISIQNGYAFASKNFTVEGGMPLIRIRDLKNGVSTQVNYLGHYDKNFLVNTGDLLIGMDGEFRCYEWRGVPSLLNQRVCRIKSESDDLNLRYLFYGINKYLKAIEDVTGFTTVKHLSSNTILNIDFPVPSLDEQLKVVEKLDNLFAETELLEKKLQLQESSCDELLLSIQNELYGKNVEMVRIGDVCKLMTGGTPTRSRKDFFLNGTVRWLVSGDIHKGEIFDCEGRITKEAMKSANTKILPLNSVMIALNGQGKTRGTVALLRTEATCNQSLVSISPINPQQLIPEYLFYNLKMRYQELRRLTGDDGNDRRGLNMILIREIKIPLPDMSIQFEVVEKLKFVDQAIQELKSIIALKRDYARNLWQSILGSSFTAENVVSS